MAAKRKRNRETAAGAEPESHANRNDTTRLLVLIFTAFAANMFIMTLELVAGRLVARFIGSSLYTWTTIVGGVLLGMAVGSYLGGRLADRHSPLKLLAVLLLLAGMACPSVLALNQIIGYAPFVRSLDWPPRIFVHVMFTFLIPCVFLGSVTPVILREALTIPIGTGRTGGVIYGAGALGSVIGTVLAWFVLIPNMGTRMIVMLMGLGLGALAVYYAWSSQQQGAVRLRTTDSDGAGPVPTRGYSPALVSALGAVFVGNASFMVYELAASRLATQYLGHSIYTWTTLLGVVLAGIMLGNYLGGRWSDRYQPDVLLPWFFAASCLFALASLPLYRWLAQGVLLDNFMWSNRIVAQITLAFFVPSVAMGTIGPAAARKAIALSALPGHTVGLIYAAGSFASVVATFVTGYVLVDTLWPIGTIMLLSVVLAMSSFVWGPRSRAWVIAMPTLLFALILAVTPNPAVQQFAGAVGLREQDGPDFVFRDHSQYSWIAVTASPQATPSFEPGAPTRPDTPPRSEDL